MSEANDDDNTKTLKAYDYQIRLLIAHIQSFILHHRHPDLFNLPDLDEAEKVWRRANDLNVRSAIPTCPTQTDVQTNARTDARTEAILERAKELLPSADSNDDRMKVMIQLKSEFSGVTFFVIETLMAQAIRQLRYEKNHIID